MSKNIEKAISKCRAYAKKLELPMNIIGAKYEAENGKLIFHFESQKRVDFRELLKLLQNELSIKIELRQVGPRDQAKEIGGIGPCGQVVCCTRYMKRFEPVSVKFIKKQGLKGSPQRYGGLCGKLQCCLRFELDEKSKQGNRRRPSRSNNRCEACKKNNRGDCPHRRNTRTRA